MGAFGNITCLYCNESYLELDEHECDMDVLKVRIEELKERACCNCEHRDYENEPHCSEECIRTKATQQKDTP